MPTGVDESAKDWPGVASGCCTPSRGEANDIPKARILIVEDEMLVASDLKARLEAVDYVITAIADSGQNAIRLASETQPDLVMMDIKLRGDMDGVEAAAHITHELGLPVIFLTAYSDAQTLARVKQVQPYGYVLKPFNDEDVYIVIELALCKHKAEKAIQESQERFRIVADWTYDWEYWINPQGRLEHVSPSCQRITGYTPEEFVRNPHLLKAISHPEDRAAITTHLRLEESTAPPSSLEFRIVTREGEVRWVGHVCQAVYSRDGHWLGRRASNRDITPRKRSEEALADERHLLRTLIDTIPDAIYVKDTQSKIVLLNKSAAQLIGVSETERSPIRYTFDTHPEYFAGEFWMNSHEIVETGKPLIDQEESNLDASGNITWLSTTKVPLLDSGGSTVGVVGIGRDITGRKEAEEMLLRRNKNLELLNRANQVLISTLDPDEMIGGILEEIKNGLQATGSSIWLVDTKTGDLVCRHIADPYGAAARHWRLPPGEGIVGTVYQNRHSLIVPDTRLDDRHFKGIDEQTGQECRSILNVPLTVRDRIIGVIQVVATQPGWFTQADLDLVESLAATTSIAIENARLYQETDELRQFNENIVTHMDEGIIVCDPQGAITFANPKSLALLGYTADEIMEKHWSALIIPQHVSRIEEMITTLTQKNIGPYETILLTNQDKEVPVIMSASAMFEMGELQGTIAVCTDITDRKRAEEALRQRNRDLELLNRVSQSLISVLNLDQILAFVVDEVRRGLGATACSVWLVDQGSQDLVCLQTSGPSSAVLENWHLKKGQGIAGYTAQVGGGGQIVPDTRLDSRHFKDIDEKTGLECRSILCVPLEVKDTVIGVLEVVDTQPEFFSQLDLRLLASLAPTVSIAIENARLHQRAEEAAALEERQRLARELHDSVTQSLYSLMLQAEGFKRLSSTTDLDTVEEWFGDLSETAYETLKAMRLLLYELRPMTVTEEGLVMALKRRLNGVEKRVGVEARLDAETDIHLPSLAQEELYRIAQEALNNALKHSGSQSIVVSLRSDEETGEFELEVKDNGRGFDPQAAKVKGGMGLTNMQERVARLGGNMTIDSSREGTSIKVRLTPTT